MEVRPELGEALNRPLVLRHPRVKSLSRALQGEMRSCDSARTQVLARLALELLGLAVRLGDKRSASNPPPRWLVRVGERLDANVREPGRVADSAGVAGVPPVHLARAFRAHFGVSPGEHVRLARVR